jgi:pimeloyl-ACP methyl ester carboxylesterase
MPYCEVGRYADGEKWEGVRLFYRRYGRGATKVLLIIGLAGTHDSWGPQIKGLTGSLEPADDEAPRPDEEAGAGAAGAAEAAPAEGDDAGGDGIEVCCFDNRGVGRSSVPPNKSYYSTAIMAKDALALMDHLGWKKAHVFGHSMGAMISCKLAAIAPHRLCSLALLNVTGGGFQCFPKVLDL